MQKQSKSGLRNAWAVQLTNPVLTGRVGKQGTRPDTPAFRLLRALAHPLVGTQSCSRFPADARAISEAAPAFLSEVKTLLAREHGKGIERWREVERSRGQEGEVGREMERLREVERG